MKHLIKNNEIVMSGLPSKFDRENGQSFWGGYENMIDLHYADGWRDEVIPEFDPNIQTLSPPYFDIGKDIVTRDVIELTDLPTIEQAKTDKIRQIKQNAFRFLAETDWYVVRKIESAKEIPADILSEREMIRQRSNELESAVLSLPTVQEVVIFEVTY